jgi:aspartate beta-hydroxylase
MRNREKPAPGTPAWQIATLTESAMQLAKSGDLAGAERIFEKILEAAPYHVRSLNALATRAMERGDINRAQILLERAVKAAPDRPMLHENLGQVLRTKGENEEALNCFRKAAELKPEFVYPWIYQAETLENLGRHEEAAFMYAKVSKLAPPEEIIATDPAIRAGKRPLIMQAIAAFKNIMYQHLLETLQEPLEEFGEPALQRVIECAKIKSGVSRATYQHALQHPDWLYVPGVKPQAFFEPDQFDWTQGLQSFTSTIKTELLALLEDKTRLAPYVNIEGDGDKKQWTNLNHSDAWSSFHLFKAAGRIGENCERFPITLKALDHIPLVHIKQHAPEVFFSILKPGTHIPPHFGLGNYKLAVHLPLLVPDSCQIRVGHETRGWSEGECLIFDDSFQHEAWNNSEQIRAVLIMEIWNPELTEPEKIGITKIVQGLNAFNEKFGL